MWRSLVAHLTGGQGVAGSNPVIPTESPDGKPFLVRASSFLGHNFLVEATLMQIGQRRSSANWSTSCAKDSRRQGGANGSGSYGSPSMATVMDTSARTVITMCGTARARLICGVSAGRCCACSGDDSSGWLPFV
jgi:hypothetical protein